MEDLPSPHNKFWVPCMWFVSLALRARTEGRINNDVALTALLTVGPLVLSVFKPIQCQHYDSVAYSDVKYSSLCAGAEQFTGEVYEAVRLRLDQPASCLHTGFFSLKLTEVETMT